MNRYRSHVFALASVAFGLLAAAPAQAAQVAQVSRNTWGATGVPNYVNMYIYVPDTLATNPPIVVACHSCGTPVSGYINSINGIQAAADRNGFILVLPEATQQNCWDVGSQQSLTHEGGGDTQAIAQMVKYVLSTYNADASRVYIMGGSSGAMMTQAMIAVYPELFKAGSARAGVPAGCWADGYNNANQWSNNCAAGGTSKSAQEWGDLVRGMQPGYTGPRRRMQLFHGTADTTINYNNMGEAIKEWTNVLDLGETPTATDSVTTAIATYARETWRNACGATVLEAWSGQGGSHSMPYEQEAILAFFGLDQSGAADPEADCPPEGGDEDSGGSSEAGDAGESESDGTASASTTSGPSAETSGAPSDEGSSTEGSGGNVSAAATFPGQAPGEQDAGGCACATNPASSRSAYALALAGLGCFVFRRRRRSR